MALVISFDEEMKDPRTLFVMEDAAAVAQHAEKFCQAQGLEYDPKRMQAKAEVAGRSFRWYWDWPREIHGVWKGGPGKWAWRYAGITLSRLELNTHVPSEDLIYLIMRMRGIPLNFSIKPKEQ